MLKEKILNKLNYLISKKQALASNYEYNSSEFSGGYFTIKDEALYKKWITDCEFLI